MFTGHNALIDYDGVLSSASILIGPLQFVNHMKEASQGGNESYNDTKKCSLYLNIDRFAF